jgi:hypothetical protein
LHHIVQWHSINQAWSLGAENSESGYQRQWLIHRRFRNSFLARSGPIEQGYSACVLPTHWLKRAHQHLTPGGLDLPYMLAAKLALSGFIKTAIVLLRNV